MTTCSLLFCLDVDNSCRTCLLWLSPLRYSGPEDCSPTEAASTKTRTCLLYPAKDHSLCLLVYLYITASPLCPAVCNNPGSMSNWIINMLCFLGVIVSPFESPVHSVPDFYLCLFCFVLSPLPPEEGLSLEPCSDLVLFCF